MRVVVELFCREQWFHNNLYMYKCTCINVCAPCIIFDSCHTSQKGHFSFFYLAMLLCCCYWCFQKFTRYLGCSRFYAYWDLLFILRLSKPTSLNPLHILQQVIGIYVYIHTFFLLLPHPSQETHIVLFSFISPFILPIP